MARRLDDLRHLVQLATITGKTAFVHAEEVVAIQERSPGTIYVELSTGNILEIVASIGPAAKLLDERLRREHAAG